MKTGIVVEGGGMRGIYAAGVLDVLLEHGIKADGLVGVSAGAIHGCSFVAGQAGRSIRYNLKYCRDPRYMSFRSLVTTGDLVGNEFCYHELPERLDPFDNDAFEASPMEFYATCTDVETGRPVYHRCGRWHKTLWAKPQRRHCQMGPAAPAVRDNRTHFPPDRRSLPATGNSYTAGRGSTSDYSVWSDRPVPPQSCTHGWLLPKLLPDHLP